MILAAFLVTLQTAERNAQEKHLAELIAEALEIDRKAREAPDTAKDPKVKNRAKAIQEEGDLLLKRLTGGDPTQEDAVVEAVLWRYNKVAYRDFLRLRIPANERNTGATLRSFAAAQEKFRADDLDRNRTNDYWVADVSGLYRIVVNGKPIAAMDDVACARADAAPARPLDHEDEVHGVTLAAVGVGDAKDGYRYRVVGRYEDAEGNTARYDGGNGRNAGKYCICAYPVEYGTTGRMTFAITETATVLQKDTEGEVPEAFPADPAAAGWKPLK